MTPARASRPRASTVTQDGKQVGKVYATKGPATKAANKLRAADVEATTTRRRASLDNLPAATEAPVATEPAPEAKAPKAPTPQYVLDGKALAPTWNKLATSPTTAPAASTATPPASPPPHWWSWLGTLGVTDVKAFPWEVTLPNGVVLGRSHPAPSCRR